MGKTRTANRLGETSKASNGQTMTIVAYRRNNDIDIEFDDGTIVRNRAYHQFKSGEIANPNIPIGEYARTIKPKSNRIGKTNTNNEGYKMEIINYVNAHWVDIKFEDGIVVCKKNYYHFKDGSIKHPIIFENGVSIIEFAYRLKDDWYYVCKHKDWKENKILSAKEICPEPIVTGRNVAKRRPIYGSLLNQVSTATNGMKIVCIEDNGSKDITVQFEDGKITYHQRRESFLAGHIRHPDKPKRVAKNNMESHIGEEWFDRNGRKMTIIEYFSNSNVTIKYDDGTILKDKEYRIIKKGADLYPKTRVGEEKIARNGLRMKIIKDDMWNDVHIQFEDGTIVTGCTKAAFDSGAIKHPTITKRHKYAAQRDGMELIMNNGMKCKVLKYHSAKSVDFKFENGMLVLDRDWTSFENKRLGMPRKFGDIFVKEFAYRLNDDWFYIVKIEGQNDEEVMSVKQIYQYLEKNQ